MDSINDHLFKDGHRPVTGGKERRNKKKTLGTRQSSIQKPNNSNVSSGVFETFRVRGRAIDSRPFNRHASLSE